MTGPTREEVLLWVYKAFPVHARTNLTRENGPYGLTEPTFYAETLADLAFAAGSRSDARDVARYRWLRDKARSVDWSRYNTGGGHTSWHRIRAAEMDADIDAAMGGNDA